MKTPSTLLAFSAAACLLLMTTRHARAGEVIKYPARRPMIVLSAPAGWKAAETSGGQTLTLTPSSAGGVYKITVQNLPDGTSGELSDICGKRAEAAMKEPGIQPINVHDPEKDKTSQGTQLAVSYCIYKEGEQKRCCFLSIVSPAPGKYAQVTAYFNGESDEGTAQEMLTSVLDSIKPL